VTSLYNPDNARTPEQREHMMSLAEDDVCVFCPEGYGENSPRVVHQQGDWIVEPNRYPYPRARTHLLIVHRAHLTSLALLSAADWLHLQAAVGSCEIKYRMDSFQLRVRSGDMSKTGATIAHLHWHMYDLENPDAA
jgi:ATP adenylyltransferase